MKKTKMTRSLLAACSIVALSAVMYGCVHSGDADPVADEPVAVDPMPEPDPGPTDLDDTQAAAVAAAAAAKTASDNAAMAASDSATATMTLATLQTGADSKEGEMGGREHADAASDAAQDAADAAEAAMAASQAAAAASTGDAAEEAWRMAVAAQADAEAAQALASTHSAAAIAAAMTELHIDGTMKWAGGLTFDAEGASSLDANADKTTSPAGDKETGFIRVLTRDSDAVTGQPYIEATAQSYRQAVEARSLEIGKEVDTTYDTHRLAIIHSRATSEMHRVYVVNAAGTSVTERGDDGIFIDNGTDGTPNTADDTYNPLKSLGMYIEAADVMPDATGNYATPPAADSTPQDFANAVQAGDSNDALDLTTGLRRTRSPRNCSRM